MTTPAIHADHRPDPRVAQVERLAAAAWPAETNDDLDGWTLRFNGGITRRANSVWAVDGRNQLLLAAKLDEVQRRYRQLKLSPCFQITPLTEPAELDAALATRGYHIVHPTSTEHVSIAEAIRKTSVRRSHRIVASQRHTPAWFDTYCAAEQVSPLQKAARQAIVERIASPTNFITIDIGGRPVATGLGVLQGEWLGIFSVATLPQSRRRGAATAVIHALAQWGRKSKAKHCYLQVMSDNVPAQALYRRVGFQTLYTYHYRELAAPDLQSEAAAAHEPVSEPA